MTGVTIGVSIGKTKYKKPQKHALKNLRPFRSIHSLAFSSPEMKSR
jgi:hypothetical protein